MPRRLARGAALSTILALVAAPIAPTTAQAQINSAPVFDEGTPATRTAHESIDHSSSTGTDFVGDPVTASDPDGDMLTYAVTDPTNSFTIDATTGQIRNRVVHDIDADTTYTVTVTADDGKGGSAPIEVAITVINEFMLVGDNDDAHGIWSDEETMWVVDRFDQRLYAYNMADYSRNAERDIVLPRGYTQAADIWSDGETLWVANDAVAFVVPIVGTRLPRPLLAYRLADGLLTQDPDDDVQDLNFYINTGIVSIGYPYIESSFCPVIPEAVWAGETRMWITQDGRDSVCAYKWPAHHPDGGLLVRPAPESYFDLSPEFVDHRGTWGNDTTMWAVSAYGPGPHGSSYTAAAYSLVGGALGRRDPAKDLRLDESSRNPWGIWSDGDKAYVSDRGRTAAARDKIYVYDLPDRNGSPAFDSGTVVRELPETSTAGAAVGAPIAAPDPDGDAVVHTMTGPDAALFSIDAANGQIRVGHGLTLDYDGTGPTVYSVTVSASDSKDAAGDPDTVKDAAADVTIRVLDVNERPTIAAATRSVSEDAAIRDRVGEPLVAIDPEGDDLIYSLSGDGSRSFAIDSATGQITVDRALDYETRSAHNLAVFVSDGRNPAGEVDPAVDFGTGVLIRVTDANDAPEFQAASYNRSVDENAAQGDPVGRPLVAFDADGDRVEYSLDGHGSASFTIDASGQVRVASSLDHETYARYSLSVKASDGTSSHTAGLVIDVLDSNDPPVTEENQAPAFTQAAYERSVAENSPPNMPVGAAVTASDPEGDQLVYMLAGTGADAFGIGDDGQITALSPLDHETRPAYSLVVTASDGTLSTQAHVEVTVSDVNEGPTVSGPIEVLHPEPDPAQEPGPLATYTAVDPEGDSVSWSLAGPDRNNLSLSGDTGASVKLSFSTRPDHEKPADVNGDNIYEVTLNARDGHGAHDSLKVSVRITDTFEDEEDAVGILTIGSQSPSGDSPPSAEPQVGGTVTASLQLRETAAVTVSWRWERSGLSGNPEAWAPITDTDSRIVEGVATTTYTPVQQDVGRFLRVTATYDESGTPGQPAGRVGGGCGACEQAADVQRGWPRQALCEFQQPGGNSGRGRP